MTIRIYKVSVSVLKFNFSFAYETFFQNIWCHYSLKLVKGKEFFFFFLVIHTKACIRLVLWLSILHSSNMNSWFEYVSENKEYCVENNINRGNLHIQVIHSLKKEYMLLKINSIINSYGLTYFEALNVKNNFIANFITKRITRCWALKWGVFHLHWCVSYLHQKFW